MADLATLRNGLVENLVDQVGTISEPVVAALRAVPRHVFVPDVPAEQAYRDEAVVTKRDVYGIPISSSSQPAIMAIMLDQLDVRRGDRVLEIGAGTGYNAALLGHLVGDAGEVVTVDIDPDLVAAARSHLASAGVRNVTAVCADGAYGFAELAPYDRLIATVGVWDLEPAWQEQLVPAGRMVAPLDLRGAQLSVAFERANGHWESREVRPCGFMRLRGAAAGPEQLRILDSASRLVLMVPDDRAVDEAAVRAGLTQPATGVSVTGVSVTSPALFGELRIWLATTDPRVCYLSAEDADASVLAQAPLAASDFQATTGLLDGPSLAVLARHQSGWPAGEAFELDAVGYGRDGADLAAGLAALVRDWEAAGRPYAAGLRVAAYPRTVAAEAAGIVIDKVHTRLVVTR